VEESNRLMTESMESLPESAKETFAQTADSLKETLAKSKEAFNKAVEKYGDDNEWWNIHPAAKAQEHQRLIHCKDSPARYLFK